MTHRFDALEVVADRVPPRAVASEGGAGVRIDVDRSNHIESCLLEPQRLPADARAQLDRGEPCFLRAHVSPDIDNELRVPTVTCPWNRS